MIAVREHIDLRVDPEAVFAFLNDPVRIATLIPRLTVTRRPSEESSEHFQGAYDFKLFGLSFPGTIRTTDYQVNRRMVWILEGALRGSVRYYVESGSRPNMTRFTVAATYRSPGPALVRPALRPVLQRGTRREVQRFLKRSKREIEASNTRSRV